MRPGVFTPKQPGVHSPKNNTYMKPFNVYTLYPTEPVRGRGNFVYDAAGTEYHDLYGGHAVISLGHAPL